MLTVRPLIWSIDQRVQNTCCNELTDSPAHVDICSQVSAKVDRSDLGSVRGTLRDEEYYGQYVLGYGREGCIHRYTNHSGEDTPTESAEDLPDQQRSDVLCKEDDENKGDHEEHGDDHDISVSELDAKLTVQDAAYLLVC